MPKHHRHHQLPTTILPTTTRVVVRPAHHEEEIKTTSRSKTTLQNRTAETRFFKPHFNVADHFYVMLCTRRGEVPSISVVARSLSSPENNAPQNTLEQQMSQLVSAFNTLRNDLKHKIEATKTDKKKLGTCGFPRTLNSAETLTNLHVLHPRHTGLKNGQTKAKPLSRICFHKNR